MRTCPICADPLEPLGVAFDEDRGREVETYACKPCGEDFVAELRPPSGWREEIRAAVRARRGAA